MPFNVVYLPLGDLDAPQRSGGGGHYGPLPSPTPASLPEPESLKPLNPLAPEPSIDPDLAALPWPVPVVASGAMLPLCGKAAVPSLQPTALPSISELPMSIPEAVLPVAMPLPLQLMAGLEGVVVEMELVVVPPREFWIVVVEMIVVSPEESGVTTVVVELPG